MKHLYLSVIVALFFLFCDTPTKAKDDCSTLSNPDAGIELVYPKGMETFSYGELVDVRFKVDPSKISLVNLKVSTTGSEGPFRNVYQKSIHVPSEGGIQCIDSVWVIGNEYDLVDYAKSGTVYVRVESYTNASRSSTSGLITVNKP